MKTNHLIKPISIALLLVIFCNNSYAQTKSKISDVFIFGGGLLMENPYLSRQEILQLAPNSTLLQQDLSKFYDNNSPYDYSGTQGATTFSVMLGFNPFKPKPNRSISPIVRVGLSFGQVNLVNQYLSYTERFPYDTLISQRTGEKIYLDSLAGSTLTMQQSGSQARVEIALLFQTNLERWVSVYSGLSAGAGLTFNNRTQIGRSNFHYGNGYGYDYYSSNSQYEWENYNNKNGYLVQTAIPIGLNVRLGKQKPILNQSFIFMEFSPGLAFYHIPELKTFTNFTYQTNVGVRFRI
jgi:hypothetical protein